MLNLRGPDGLRVKLDKTQIYPQDPGMGTPVLVISRDGNAATLNCALGERELMGEGLSDDQMSWLEEIAPECDEWLSEELTKLKKYGSLYS